MTIAIGGKLWIKGDWDTNPVPAGRIPILIHPNMHVEGAGYNPPTRTLLELLERYVQPDSIVLDVGAGSGILAIAAIKLGAVKAVATDIGATALATIPINARVNAVEDKLLVVDGTFPDAPAASFDLIVSNIGVIPEKQYLGRAGLLLKSRGMFLFTASLANLEDYELALFGVGLHRINHVEAGEGMHVFIFQKV